MPGVIYVFFREIEIPILQVRTGKLILIGYCFDALLTAIVFSWHGSLQATKQNSSKNMKSVGNKVVARQSNL